MWSRLGIVLSVLALIIVPLYVTMDIAGELAELRNLNYRLCMRSASRMLEGQSAAMDRCWQERFSDSFDFWGQWRDALGVTAIGILICWILLGLVVATIRWIWAGRKKV